LLAKTPALGVEGIKLEYIIMESRTTNPKIPTMVHSKSPQGDSRHGNTRNMVTICIIHIGYNKSYHIESILE
jgi:hypothetical protein